MSTSSRRLLLLAFTSAALAQLSNLTIDDELGDNATGALPEYFGDWVQGAKCGGCAIQLNTANLFDGTLHRTVTSRNQALSPTITLRFTGVAIYVYNVLANSVPSANFATGTDLTFTLDDEPDGRFVHDPTDSTQFLFNHTVYARTNLANAEHVLVIRPNTESLCMFDYAEYTAHDEPTVSSSGQTSASLSTSDSLPSAFSSALSTYSSTSTSAVQYTTPSTATSMTSSIASPQPDGSNIEYPGSPSQHLGARVGAALGGVALLVLLAALLLYIRAKRRTVWSSLPSAYDGTTEAQQRRLISSVATLEDDLYIIPALRPSKTNGAFHPSSTRHSLATMEDLSERPSSTGLLGSIAGLADGRQNMRSTRTSSIQVIVDGKLQSPDVGPFSPPAASTSGSGPVLRSISTAPPARSTEMNKVLSQLTSLQAEVARLRGQQEAGQERFVDPPPRYDEGM